MRSADGSLAHGAGPAAGAGSASVVGASRLHAARKSRVRRQARVAARRIARVPACGAATPAPPRMPRLTRAQSEEAPAPTSVLAGTWLFVRETLGGRLNHTHTK